MRLAFVSTWFGKGINGGAEAECYGLVENLRRFNPEFKIDVITTTLKEFSADWNTPYHPVGVSVEDGIKVFRFNPTFPKRDEFHAINGFRLMPQYVDDLWFKDQRQSPLDSSEEKIYESAMIQSPAMAAFLKDQRANYDYFIFIPYMFGPTFWGSKIVRNKAIIIPCLHNERYIYMNLFQSVMAKAEATIYHVPSEQKLANKVFPIKSRPQLLLGEMVETNPPKGDPNRFRRDFKIQDPFILYAGRKIAGKNLPLLVRYFSQERAKGSLPKNLKLVIMGGGDLSYDKDQYPDVVDLGFLSAQSKYDAFSAATSLIQPSLNESFSIVMMEAWLQKVPVCVYDKCEVTSDHIDLSKGGFKFSSSESFAAVVNKLVNDVTLAKELGKNGYEYVVKNYTPEIISSRLAAFLKNLKTSPRRVTGPDQTVSLS